jgi:hypothetical protein
MHGAVMFAKNFSCLPCSSFDSIEVSVVKYRPVGSVRIIVQTSLGIYEAWKHDTCLVDLLHSGNHIILDISEYLCFCIVHCFV